MVIPVTCTNMIAADNILQERKISENFSLLPLTRRTIPRSLLPATCQTFYTRMHCILHLCQQQYQQQSPSRPSRVFWIPCYSPAPGLFKSLHGGNISSRVPERLPLFVYGLSRHLTLLPQVAVGKIMPAAIGSQPVMRMLCMASVMVPCAMVKSIAIYPSQIVHHHRACLLVYGLMPEAMPTESTTVATERAVELHMLFPTPDLISDMTEISITTPAMESESRCRVLLKTYMLPPGISFGE